MENLKWKRSGEFYHLTGESNVRIRLSLPSKNRGLFDLNGRSYECTRSGSWRIQYTIASNGIPGFSLKHSFWGSRGQMHINDQLYTFVYDCNSGLKILDENSDLILSYEGKYHDHILLKGEKDIPTKHFYILAAVGLLVRLHMKEEQLQEDELVILLAAAS
jgi:hypothetical protein